MSKELADGSLGSWQGDGGRARVVSAKVAASVFGTTVPALVALIRRRAGKGAEWVAIGPDIVAFRLGSRWRVMLPEALCDSLVSLGST